jgi:glucosamine--fructose-6-phosphate aminotransferase (isomerizing)
MRSLGNFPDPFLSEIHGQPDAFRRSAEGLPGQRAEFERLSHASRSATNLVFTGMGSSYHACFPAINELAALGIAAHHIDGSELLHFRRAILSQTALVIAVSQSGESAEITQLAAEVRSALAPPVLVSVTNGLENTLAELADLTFDTRAGIETGPSTMTFGVSLIVLRAVAGVLRGAAVETALEETVRAAQAAAMAAGRLLGRREADPMELAAWLGPREVVVLLGRGRARAASEMGALLLKESAGIPAEALQAAQFRHGPLELAGPKLAAIVMATERETHRIDLGLAADLVDTGTAVLVVTPDGETPTGARAVAIGDLDRALAPSVSILPVQLLAWRLAVERGRTPGVLTRASKVTTRE